MSIADRAEAAIRNAFEGEGEAWSDKLSGDRLAEVARNAIEPILNAALADAAVGPFLALDAEAKAARKAIAKSRRSPRLDPVFESRDDADDVLAQLRAAIKAARG